MSMAATHPPTDTDAAAGPALSQSSRRDLAKIPSPSSPSPPPLPSSSASSPSPQRTNELSTGINNGISTAQVQVTSDNAVDQDNPTSLAAYVRAPDSDPSSIQTILSLSGYSPGPSREEDETEYLDYLLKGRSRASKGHFGDFSPGNWTTAAPAGNTFSSTLENNPGGNSSLSAGRRSTSNPRTSMSLRPAASASSSDHSLEMLPLSEFLAQPMESSNGASSAWEGANNRMDTIPELNFHQYGPPMTIPPPVLLPSNQTGRIPITTASGEFSGFQQLTPLQKDVRYGSHSRMTTREHDGGVTSSNSHETQPTITDNGDGANGQGEDDSLNQGKPVRNYKVYPGRNVFLCGGRIMTSRDFPAFIVAILLLLVPTGLFYGFTSPFLWHRLSPAAPITHAYLFIITLSSMLKTSWTDPGVIPRGIDGDPPVDPLTESDVNSASFYPPRSLPRLKEIQVGVYTVRLKYCDTCMIYRPPRCSHCRQCDNCVEDEDHHCVWLNNCIGRRNYRYFLIFVTTASLYGFYTSALSLTHLLLLYHDRSVASASFQSSALAKAPVSALVMIYSLIMALAVGSLATYHFWLATKNRTTHEQLSASLMAPYEVDNPFDQGNIFRNCAAVFCKPPTRSYIRRRDYTLA